MASPLGCGSYLVVRHVLKMIQSRIEIRNTVVSRFRTLVVSVSNRPRLGVRGRVVVWVRGFGFHLGPACRRVDGITSKWREGPGLREVLGKLDTES